MSFLGMGKKPPAVVTPDRRTIVRFDVAITGRVEPSFGMIRKADQIKKGTFGYFKRVYYLKDVGIELEPYQARTHFQHERTEANAGVLTTSNGNMTTASGVLEVYANRPPSELPHATTGQNASASAGSQDIFLQKKLVAGENLDDAHYVLSADQSTFPSPEPENDTYVMDRTALSTSNHEGTDSSPIETIRPIFIRILVPGTSHKATSTIATNTFCGPAGGTVGTIGLGQYAVKWGGDGLADLFEKYIVPGGDPAVQAYVKRATFRYCEAHRTMSTAHRIQIRPVIYKTPREGKSGSIMFVSEAAEDAQGSSGALTKYLQETSLPTSYKYFAPYHKQPLPTHAAPIRTDANRALRPQIQVSYAVYPTTGEFRDDKFGMEFYPNENISGGVDLFPIRIEWYGVIPTGCTLDAKLYDGELTGDTETELVLQNSGTFTDGGGSTTGGFREYKPVFGKRHYFVKGFLTGPGTKTPIFVSYRVIRSGRAEVVAPGEFTGGTLREFTKIGADGDAQSETASLHISDLAAQLPILSRRGLVPVQVETQYDPADATKHAILFRGYVAKANARRRGSKLKKGMDPPGLAGAAQLAVWPDPAWKDLSLTLVGEWRRIQNTLAPGLWSWANDPNSPTGDPYKVTDAIVDCLHWCGYLDEDIDVPDNSLRLFLSKDLGDYQVEAGANLWDIIHHFARDYLGRWMAYDPCAGTSGRGMWRLLTPPIPPYNNLASFQTTGPDANKLVAFLGSYPVATVSGQKVPSAFIRKNSLDSFVRPPEANLVTVTSTGQGLFENSPDQGTQTAANPRSYNFAHLAPGDPLLPDPTDPDYLPWIEPLAILDNSLSTDEARRYVLRRIYDRVAHGSKVVTFEAPLLLVTDKNDAKQTCPRPLRFYDPVTIDGNQFLVRSVHLAYRKDWIQMAVYECEIPGVVRNGVPVVMN